MNRTALSNLSMCVSVTRKEQCREVFYCQTPAENQRDSGVLRPRDHPGSLADGRPGLFFDLAVFQADHTQSEGSPQGMVEILGSVYLVSGVNKVARARLVLVRLPVILLC